MRVTCVWEHIKTRNRKRRIAGPHLWGSQCKCLQFNRYYTLIFFSSFFSSFFFLWYHHSPLSGISARLYLEPLVLFWDFWHTRFSMNCNLPLDGQPSMYYTWSWIATFQWTVTLLCTDRDHGCLTSVIIQVLVKPCHWHGSHVTISG